MNAHRSPSTFCYLLSSIALLILVLPGCSDETPTGNTGTTSTAIQPGSPNQAEKHFPPGLVIDFESMTSTGPVRHGPSTVPTPPPVWEPDFGTGLNQYDDDCDNVSIGFDFVFYGVTYDHVWVNSNGNMTFNFCNTAWYHPDVPDGSNVLIAPLYGDFNPYGGGDVFVNQLGTAPNRRLVVTWAGVPEYSPSGSPSTFQAQLFEGSNEILFGYMGLGTDGFNWSYNPPSTDYNMDVGISSGTGAYINSASGSAIPALDGTNICYRPDGAGGYFESFGSCTITVDIDIKPGSDPNSINCGNASETITVVILTTDTFDALTVDHTTVTFEGAMEYHTSPSGELRRHDEEDVDEDGDIDLEFHFRLGDTTLSCDSTEGTLVGQTFGGESIVGSDAVRMVPPTP